MDQFSLVESVDGLGQGVVITVALAAYRGLNAGFCQALTALYREVLRAPVSVVDQGVSLRLARVKSLLQRVEHEVGMHRAADAPADDAPSKDVDDEGDVDETLPGRDVCEIADPQLVRPLRLELAVDPVKRTRCLGIGNRGTYDLAAHDPTQAALAHQAFDRAAGHIGSLTPQLVPDLVGAIVLQVRLPDALNINAQHIVALSSCTTQCRVALLRRVSPVTRRRDLHHSADRLDAIGMAILVGELPHDLKQPSMCLRRS